MNSSTLAQPAEPFQKRLRHRSASMQTSKRERGVSLLEVLIAVLVLSIGLLGIAGLQTANLRNTQSAQQRTVAVLLAASMAERIRANTNAALNGAFEMEKSCDIPGADGSIHTVEQHFWMSEIWNNLGKVTTSCGEVRYDAENQLYTVNVYWDDSRAVGGSPSMMISHLVRL